MYGILREHGCFSKNQQSNQVNTSQMEPTYDSVNQVSTFEIYDELQNIEGFQKFTPFHPKLLLVSFPNFVLLNIDESGSHWRVICIMESVYPEFINKVVQLNSEISKNVVTRTQSKIYLNFNLIAKCLTYEYGIISSKLWIWYLFNGG